jgi:hypothetical protein
LDFRQPGERMSRKKKKPKKVTVRDTEKAIEEDKAYSTMELEEDFS